MPDPSPTLPPNPSLVAILLIVRSRAGPRLVFHYPPDPSNASQAAPARSSWHGTTSTPTDESDTSSETAWGSDTDVGADEGGDNESDVEGTRADSRISRGAGSTGGSRHDTAGASSLRSARARGPRGTNEINEEVEARSSGSEDEGGVGKRSAAGKKDGEGAKRKGESEWERILGFGAEGLEKLLSPTRAFHKRRFEVGIEGLVFLGAPMFIREDRTWKKKRRRRREREETGDNDKALGAQLDGGDDEAKQNHAADPGNESETDEGIDMDHDERAYLTQVQGFEAGYGHSLPSGAASEAGSDTKSTSTTGTENDMTMFNIVFVLNPPILEYQLRVEEMYDNVVKKFAKTLKFEQAHCNYVWKESRAILAMKEKAKENKAPTFTLWPNIIASSSLAKSMAVIYDAISTSKIAHISLDAAFDAFFQIPQAISTPYVPTPTEPQMPGLWLTTATLLDDEDTDVVSPHSALLLLADAEVLLKEIEGDAKDLSAPLAYLIRNLNPTKSLQRFAMTHSLNIKDVQFLASHLIYWRRARAIPPLHFRDTYVVSPNADMSALSSAIPAYAARFPTLPSLPKMLHALSGPPRQYTTLIPSKDHRSAYMEILAWLMRGGWVTQLRLFAWVRVSPEVKAAVAAKKAKKAHRFTEGAIEEAKEGDGVNATNGTQSASIMFHKRSHSNASDNTATALSNVASPRLSAYRSPSHPASDAGSTSSSRTVVPIGLTPASPPSTLGLTHRPSPLHMAHAASPDSPEATGSTPVPPLDASSFTASLIHSPQKANALEARWIEHIGASFADPELRELWPVLLKYFDGRHAMGEAAVREGLKRKRVAAVVQALREGGWLLCVRHW